MGNLEKKPGQAFFNSPIMKLTKKLESNKEWTVSDKVLTTRILIGCAKITTALNSQRIMKMAMSKHLLSQYDTAIAYLFGTFLVTRKDKAYSADIYEMLTDSLKSVEQSDVHEMFGFMTELGVKEKQKEPKPKLSRGRPSDKGVESIIRPGRRRIFLEDTKYTKTVRKLLSRPIVRNLIYCYIFESLLLQKWLFAVCLFFLYRLKTAGYKIFTRTRIFSFFRFDNNMLETEAKKLYHQIRLLNDDKLTERAWKISNEISNNYTDKLEFMQYTFNYICMLGVLLYQYPVFPP